METLLELVPDLTEGAEFWLTAVGVAFWVWIVVNILKRLAFQPEHRVKYWYDGAVLSMGAIVGIVTVFIAYIANDIEITVQNVALAVLAGVMYGAAAAGGYQWIKAGRHFAAGLFSGRQPLKDDIFKDEENEEKENAE